MLSGSARVVSLRARPLSGPHDPPSRRVGGPQPCGSATSGHGPGRRLVRMCKRRRRVHQPEPACPGEHLLGEVHTPAQMSYDLRRLRLKGVITRLPHTNTYLLTPDGCGVAVFYGPCSPTHHAITGRAPSPTHPGPPRRRLHRAGPHGRMAA